MTKRAGIYTRQSKELTEGIDRQIERCTKLCDAREWTVAKTYRDNDVSASKRRDKGTQWAEMLADIKAGLIDVVVAVDLDRLLRNVADLITLTELGIPVLTVDGEIDLTTADGEFRATMLAGIARFEVRRKGERQTRANQARAAKGMPNPGRRRYGYESDGMTPREDEAQVVRDIFEWFDQGTSIRGIVTELNDRDVKPTTGKEWSTRRIRAMLENPAYGGMVIHQGAALPSEHVAALVAPELSTKARAKLDDPSRRTQRGNAVRHLLSGIAVCDVCGAPMFYMRAYRCKKDASHPSIAKAILEDEALWNFFLYLLSMDVDSLDARQDRTAPVVAKLTELHRERATAQQIALMPGADLDDVRRTLARLGRDIDTTTEELASLRAQNASVSVRDILDEVGVIRLGKDGTGLTEVREGYVRFREVFDALDIERRRELIRGNVRITVANGRTVDRVSVDGV